MLNTININLKTDIKTDRPTSLPITLMSQDKNNNQFILRFTNGGESVTLDYSYTVEVLTKFTKSGTSRLTSAVVNQDYATWEFDTTYIAQDETVYNYVYVRKSGSLVVSADSNAFYFAVGLSEIDKTAGKVAETYDGNYEKILDDFKESVNMDYIESNEVERVMAETLRLSEEAIRVSSETNRVSNENARKSAEVIRLANETGRVNAETVRSEFYEGFDGRLDDLSSLLGWHTAEDVVGLEVDFVNSIFTRLAGAVGKTAGADFNSLRAFGGRKRCNLTDGGVVLAYFGDVGYTETGQITQAVTKDGVTYPIGTQVQVMVEQPSFYYKVVPLTIEPIVGGKGYHLRKARYYVSDTKQVGFKLHPAFIRNNKTLTKIYPSAFEGALYDVSEGAYNLTDAQTGVFTAGAGDKLSSIANAKPASGLTQFLTRAGARIVAQNRGAGWELMYAATAAATQLLFAIEYGTFNTQTAIGMGVSKTDDGATNMADPTGATSALGNASGKAENGSVTYRGEENFWMNIWEWVDGMNVKPQGLHELYVADHNFADDKGDGSYINAGITMAKVSGFFSAFAYNEPFDWLFMPSETLGNSSVPVGDYFYQSAASSAGWLAAILGGSWNSSWVNGGFYWHLSNSSADRNRTHGARLVYVGGAV